MGKLAEHWVEIGAKIDKFIAGMGQVDKKMVEIGRKMSAIGKKMTIGITLPLAAAGGAAIKMAMDAVESENLFEVSMKKMADDARKWSEKLRDELGLNSYEVRKTVGTFNVMINSMGLGEDAAYDMAKGLTQLTYDMASFYNLRPEEAFLKLQSGISGEIEPLKRLGIIVNETIIKHWALTNGLIKQGQQLTEEQKVLARYNVIMEQTKDAQGDLARTLDSPANKLRILKSRITETAIEMGMKMLPTFEKVMKMVEKVVIWFSSLSDATKENIIKFAGLAVVTGPLLIVLGSLIKTTALLTKANLALMGTFGKLALVIVAAYGAYKGLIWIRDKWEGKLSESQQKIEDELKAWQNLAAGVGGFTDFLEEAGKREVLSAKERIRIWHKYKDDAIAGFKAIAEGKEGEKLKSLLKELGGEHLKAAREASGHSVILDEISGSLENLSSKLGGLLGSFDEYSKETAKIMAEMTDEVMKASLTEYEYRKWSALKTYEKRKTLLTKEKADKEAFVLLEKSLSLELEQIEKDKTKTVKDQYKAKGEAITAYFNKVKEKHEAFKNYLSEYTDIVKQYTLSEKDYRLWQLDEWYNTELTKLEANLTDVQMFYDAKIALDEAYATRKKSILAELSDYEKTIFFELTNVVRSMVDEFLTMFERWGEGTGNILQNIGLMFKNMADTAIGALKNLASQSLILAAQEILAEKAKAIASMIAKVMKSVPFPLNLALVGGAIAAVSALFSKISVPKLEKGGWLPQPTLVEAGHGPKGEIIAQPATLAKIITQEMPRVASPELALAGSPFQPIINIYPQQAMDRDGVDRLGEEIMRAVNRAKNRGL